MHASDLQVCDGVSAAPQAPGIAADEFRSLEAIRTWLSGSGAAPGHIQRLMRLWTHALPWDTPARHPFDHLPARVLGQLPVMISQLDRLAHVLSEQSSSDGSLKLLVGLNDGQTVESVLLPRDGVCVSSQVGCAVGCVFCMTGRGGLARQLGSAEMVAQVVLARRRRPVRKVVFMGMGEPAHNLDNVLEAIDTLAEDGMIGHKNLVLSTVGDHRVFERLAQRRIRPALALSLHTSRAELRAKLLPRAPAIAPDELVERGQTYAQLSGYPIQYQWTLIEGINDSDEEVQGIARLLRGKYAVMNLIPYNRVESLEYRRPDWQRAAEIARTLHRQGILTKLRQSAGQDVDAGCGQLRARQVPVEFMRSPSR